MQREGLSFNCEDLLLNILHEAACIVYFNFTNAIGWMVGLEARIECMRHARADTRVDNPRQEHELGS